MSRMRSCKFGLKIVLTLLVPIAVACEDDDPTAPPPPKPKPVVVLYEHTQGTQTASFTSAFNNQNVPTSQKVAENFQLALPSTMTQVEWTATTQGMQGGTIVEWFVELYSAHPGTPGPVDTLISSQSFPFADTNEDTLGGGWSRYSAALAVPVQLDSSVTYWFAVNADMGGQPGLASWLATDEGGTIGDGLVAVDVNPNDGTWDILVANLPGSFHGLVFAVKGTVP